MLQVRQLAVLHQVLDDLEIVRGLEGGRQDQRAALDLVHRIFELGAAVRRVHVHQHQSRFRSCELRERPFRGVGRPDTDPVATLEPQGQQAGGQLVDPPPQLAPAPAHVLVADHQRLAVAMGLDGPVEESADRFADQLLLRDAMIVRDFRGSLSFGHE